MITSHVAQQMVSVWPSASQNALDQAELSEVDGTLFGGGRQPMTRCVQWHLSSAPPMKSSLCRLHTAWSFKGGGELGHNKSILICHSVDHKEVYDNNDIINGNK